MWLSVATGCFHRHPRNNHSYRGYVSIRRAEVFEHIAAAAADLLESEQRIETRIDEVERRLYDRIDAHEDAAAFRQMAASLAGLLLLVSCAVAGWLIFQFVGLARKSALPLFYYTMPWTKKET